MSCVNEGPTPSQLCQGPRPVSHGPCQSWQGGPFVGTGRPGGICRKQTGPIKRSYFYGTEEVFSGGPSDPAEKVKFRMSDSKLWKWTPCRSFSNSRWQLRQNSIHILHLFQTSKFVAMRDRQSKLKWRVILIVVRALLRRLMSQLLWKRRIYDFAPKGNSNVRGCFVGKYLRLGHMKLADFHIELESMSLETGKQSNFCSVFWIGKWGP